MTTMDGEALGPSVRGPRRPARARLAWVFAVLGVALLAGTGVAFLNTNSTAQASISPLSTSFGGRGIDVVSVSNSVTVTNGQAQTQAGVELYRIDLASKTLGDQLLIHFDWVNGQDAQKVLNNPNAWIQVGVYDNNGVTPVSSACSSGLYLSGDNVCVSADPGAKASAQLTAANADALLVPTQNPTSDSSLYLVAAITTPGHAPPGQQSGLTTLQYNVDARLH